jgi:hypothetical protein
MAHAKVTILLRSGEFEGVFAKHKSNSPEIVLNFRVYKFKSVLLV